MFELKIEAKFWADLPLEEAEYILISRLQIETRPGFGSRVNN
jgi:hypothetical protein